MGSDYKSLVTSANADADSPVFEINKITKTDDIGSVQLEGYVNTHLASPGGGSSIVFKLSVSNTQVYPNGLLELTYSDFSEMTGECTVSTREIPMSCAATNLTPTP